MLVTCTFGSPLDPQDLWKPYLPHWCVPQLKGNWNKIGKWPTLATKDPIFLATSNLLTNDCRNLKLEIYFISAGCWCFEHTPICVTDSTEWLVTQDSSIIHHNIYTSKILQSCLYDPVSIHNRIIVCYSLATCQKENKPLCKATITTLNHIMKRKARQTMCIYYIIVVHSHNHCCYGNTSSLKFLTITNLDVVVADDTLWHSMAQPLLGSPQNSKAALHCPELFCETLGSTNIKSVLPWEQVPNTLGQF